MIPGIAANPDALTFTLGTGKSLIDHLATHTPDGNPTLYLAFDDGPSTYTQKLLDMLAKYKAHSTFFVIGGKTWLSSHNMGRCPDGLAAS